MGNSVKVLSDRVSLIASEKLWVEHSALQQLEKTAELPGITRAVGLPDIHPGRGYPVGAAFFSVAQAYPALVGGDIGCGAALWQTDLPRAKARLDKLDKAIGNLDHRMSTSELSELDPHFADRLDDLKSELDALGLDPKHADSGGTIGQGNHFAELQSVDTVLDAPNFDRLGLDARALQLVVHSGSRGLGQAILTGHVEQFGHRGLADGSDALLAYIRRHDLALRFATLNRELIAARVLHRIRASGVKVIDVAHNTVLRATSDGVDGWIHRKGANPATEGVVILPGSRDDYTYLVQPASDCGASLDSLPHGAGRKWQRTDCRGRLERIATPASLTRTSFGGRVVCGDKDLIFEEAAQAYKAVDTVLGSLFDAGLVTVVARNKPLLTYKTRGECC